MNILSIETTSEAGSIALVSDNSILYEIFFQSDDIASRLIDYIETVFSKTGNDFSSIDCFTVSCGPGSWTGTRVGISLAKGLSAGEGKPLYCVSAPQSLFFSLKDLKMPCICLINAYRERFYVSEYNGRFSYKNSYLPTLMSKEDIAGICGEKEVLLTGPGVSLLPAGFFRKRNMKFPEKHFLYPRAGINALLSAERISRDIPSLAPSPYYGR